MDKEMFEIQITDEDIEWVKTIMPDIFNWTSVESGF